MGARFWAGMMFLGGFAALACAQTTGFSFQATSPVNIGYTSATLPSSQLTYSADTVVHVNPMLAIVRNGNEALKKSINADVLYLPRADQMIMQSVTVRVYWTGDKLEIPLSAAASILPMSATPFFGMRSTVLRSKGSEIMRFGQSPQHVQALTFTVN